MQVQGVPVRVERVPHIPHGAKVLIDGPSDAELVAWVREDLESEEAAALVARCLMRGAGSSRRLETAS